MANTKEAWEPKENLIQNVPADEQQTEGGANEIDTENDKEFMDDDVEEGSLEENQTETSDTINVNAG